MTETTNPATSRRKHTIVIADDDRDLVGVLETRCRALGLDVAVAYEARTAINIIHSRQPAIVCLDVNMPAGNGLSVCQLLSADKQFSSTPVIIMSGETSEETVRSCHRLCAYYVEKGNDVWPRIEPLLYELLDLEPETVNRREVVLPTAAQRAISVKENSTTNRELIDVVFDMLATDMDFLDRSDDNGPSLPWILCIDDDADYSNVLRHRLEHYGIAVRRAFEGMEGFRFAFTQPADVILLDYELPNGRGDYILQRLKSNPVTEHIPVIVITGRKERSLERHMRSCGAANFFTKPPDMNALMNELRLHMDVLPASCPPAHNVR